MNKGYTFEMAKLNHSIWLEHVGACFRTNPHADLLASHQTWLAGKRTICSLGDSVEMCINDGYCPC